MSKRIVYDIKELIKRTKSLECIQENISERNAYPHNKKYQATEKGREALRRGWKKRSEQMKENLIGLCEKESHEIKEFYKNRPKGHHVDHILAVSKGGVHRMSNLQYLTVEENRKKYNKTDAA